MRLRAILGAGAIAAAFALMPDRAEEAPPDAPIPAARAARPAPLFTPGSRSQRADTWAPGLPRRGAAALARVAAPDTDADMRADLPPVPPPAQLPETPAQLRDDLVRLSAAVTPEGVRAYALYVDALRTDRALAAELLHDALAELPPGEQRGPDGRRLIHTMGAVADPSSLPVLAGVATRPVPPMDPTLGHGDPDPHRDGAIAAALALDAMVKVVDRAPEAEAIATLQVTLEELLADPETSPHVAVKASLLLRAHADDPAAERLRQAQLLGERSWVAHVEPRTSLPPLEAQSRTRH